MKTTQKEFFEILKRSSKRGVWNFVGDTIRNKSGVCPVCYVSNIKLKENKHYADWMHASRDIGLNQDFAKLVADAADDVAEGFPDEYKKEAKLRKKLIKVLNLK